MKNIDKDVYKEKRIGRGHLIAVAVVVGVIALAMIIGGIVLFVKGCKISGVWATIWRIAIGIVLALFGGSLGWVAVMMFFTGNSLIKVKDGNVKDLGNSAIGTVNVLKCNKCGEQLPEDSTFCTKCGTEVDGVVVCDCGTINSQENEYCKKCGKKLK